VSVGWEHPKKEGIMASSVPAELLKQLSSASEALNNVSDIFNEQIKVIEDALASYNIGVSAWVQAFVESYEDCDRDGRVMGIIETGYTVGYQKWAGRWSLMVASECDYGRPPDYPDRTEWVLRDAPRDIRLKAIDAIPKLIEALIAEANRLAAEVTKKTTEARMLAASIQPRKG
jgi:hypothetical protein